MAAAAGGRETLVGEEAAGLEGLFYDDLTINYEIYLVVNFLLFCCKTM